MNLSTPAQHISVNHSFEVNKQNQFVKKHQTSPALHINQHMISEGSCDIEDWSNDAENSAKLSQE